MSMNKLQLQEISRLTALHISVCLAIYASFLLIYCSCNGMYCIILLWQL